MREELYINNQRVDLAEKSGINLNYNSNLFGDISRISGNVSYTINLPRTVNNCRIMGVRHILSNASSSGSFRYGARYLRNGITVIGSASAHLMKVTEDTFQIILLWGVMTGLEEFIRKNLSLKDLNMRLVVKAGKNAYNYDEAAGEGIIFPDMDWGDTRYNRLQPAMRASWIFEKVEEETEVYFNIPDERKEFMERLLIPCTTRVGYSGVYTQETKSEFREIYVEDGYFRFPDWEPQVEDGCSEYITTAVANYQGFRVLKEGKIRVELDFTGNREIDVIVNEGGTNRIIELPYNIENGWYRFKSFEFEVTDARDCTVDFRTETSFESKEGGYQRMTFYFQPKWVEPGMEYPLEKNLPDINLVDFILSVCVLGGMFATMGESDNEVNFVTFDTLCNNKPKAIDWSDKLISGITGTPKELTFAVNDFAQNNHLYYKEDEQVNVNADGKLVINDTSLTRNRDMATVIFSPSEVKNSKAYIPLYTEEEGVQMFVEEISPRILREVSLNGKSTATFQGLDFPSLLKTNYKVYQKVIDKPICIKEDFYLHEFDLASLDYTIPVYLRQYGSYFAIVSIQTNIDGTCNCELIKV